MILLTNTSGVCDCPIRSTRGNVRIWLLNLPTMQFLIILLINFYVQHREYNDFKEQNTQHRNVLWLRLSIRAIKQLLVSFSTIAGIAWYWILNFYQIQNIKYSRFCVRNWCTTQQETFPGVVSTILKSVPRSLFSKPYTTCVVFSLS